ncbi:MAG: hypothetical protein IH989_08805 [Planctomycetes bacterium]|nr:hypothetical protein [Planctomycetota bacterium]
MIHPIDSGWLRTGDALHKRERRQRPRSRKHNDEGVKRDGEPQAQEILSPDVVKGTFDLVA